MSFSLYYVPLRFLTAIWRGPLFRDGWAFPTASLIIALCRLSIFDNHFVDLIKWSVAPESTQKRPFVWDAALALRFITSHKCLRACPLIIGTCEGDGFLTRFRLGVVNLTLFDLQSRVVPSLLYLIMPLRFNRFVRSTVVDLYWVPFGYD